MAKRSVALLRKLPDSKRMLARSLYYLSKYIDGEDEGAEKEKEAIELYHECCGRALDSPSLTTDHFDNLIIAYNR